MLMRDSAPALLKAPDPILAELWEIKRQLNEAAGYRVDERARMAHEAALQVEARWHQQNKELGHGPPDNKSRMPEDVMS